MTSLQIGYRKDIKVASWNIEFALKVDEAIEVLAAQPFEDFDVLFLQEMDEGSVKKIADASECFWEYNPAGDHPTTKKEFGVGIVSRLPLKETTRFVLPGQAKIQGAPRAGLGASIVLNQTPVWLWTAHTSIQTMSLKKRSAQLEFFTSQIESKISTGEEKIIFGGDINTASQRSLKRFSRIFAEAGMSFIESESTVRKYGRNFFLDHFFVKGFEPTSNGSTQGHEASDHDPIWVTLKPS